MVNSMNIDNFLDLVYRKFSVLNSFAQAKEKVCAQQGTLDTIFRRWYRVRQQHYRAELDNDWYPQSDIDKRLVRDFMKNRGNGFLWIHSRNSGYGFNQPLPNCVPLILEEHYGADYGGYDYNAYFFNVPELVFEDFDAWETSFIKEREKQIAELPQILEARRLKKEAEMKENERQREAKKCREKEAAKRKQEEKELAELARLQKKYGNR